MVRLLRCNKLYMKKVKTFSQSSVFCFCELFLGNNMNKMPDPDRNRDLYDIIGFLH